MPAIIVGLCISFPLLMLFLIVDNYRNRDDMKFKQKFDALYARNKTSKNKYMLYIGVYFARRFVFVVALILLEDYYSITLNVIIVSNLLVVLYLAGVKPFIERSDLAVEIVNEILIYAFGICFLCMGFHHENP